MPFAQFLNLDQLIKIPGGLNGVEEEFRRMMENRVNAQKLVYTAAKTTNPCPPKFPSHL